MTNSDEPKFFILLAGKTYYPPGIGTFRGRYASLDEAKTAYNTSSDPFDWCQIMDFRTGAVELHWRPL